MPSDTKNIIQLINTGKYFSKKAETLPKLISLLLNNHTLLDSHPNKWALHPINLEINRGEVLGIIGRNGAGKSTLLKLIAGTLEPSCGKIIKKGRIAALLELGAGFNPEFTGRENIYFYASLIGISTKEINNSIDEIIDFSGLGPSIDNHVKTYSSGMYVRLAFSIATSIQPDLLIIDEALSVGDGEFASQSFERIMSLRNNGVSIIFCSHSMYQVQALSTKAIWLEGGRICASGSPVDVITAYEETQKLSTNFDISAHISTDSSPTPGESENFIGVAKIKDIKIAIDGNPTPPYIAISGKSTVSITISYTCSDSIEKINVATGFVFPDGRIVTSVATHFSEITQHRPYSDHGEATVIFPALPLLKGVYWIGAYLFCKDGIHVYDRVHQAARVVVTQETLEQGFVKLPHTWISA